MRQPLGQDGHLLGQDGHLLGQRGNSRAQIGNVASQRLDMGLEPGDASSMPPNVPLPPPPFKARGADPLRPSRFGREALTPPSPFAVNRQKRTERDRLSSQTE
jgi:hypothetical protein